MSFYRALRLLAIVLLMAGLPSAAVAQARGTGPSRPTTGSNGLSTAQPPLQPPDRMSRIMLSGNVIIEDGSPLREPVSIERVCNGRVSREGRTDFQGYFTITIGPGFAGFSDAGATAEASSISGSQVLNSLATQMPHSTLTQQNALMGCELRASLAGFRSSLVRIPTGEMEAVGPVRVGTIVLERMGQAQGATVSATSLNAPKDARKAYEKGHHAIQHHKLPAAQQELEKAVQLYPQYAAAWVDLGWVYVQQNQLDKARNAFSKAQTADGMFVPAYIGLSSLALRESKWAEAAEFSDHATQLDGVDFPVAFFYYNSLANYRLGNLEQAEKSARKAETMGVQHAYPQVSLLLGVMLANRREYADAADQLRSYLKAEPTAPNADNVRQKLAEVEKLGATESKAAAAPPAK
jgi:outer membrane protein assembly factor BamD (BamD/ComL family)